MYLTLRPDAMITVLFQKMFNFSFDISKEKSICNSPILKLIRNHFADGLWAYASTIAILTISKIFKLNQKWMIIICVLLDIVLEVTQIVNPFFTFDFWDLLIELLCTLIAWYVVVRFCKSN
jgi:hypothetical protein